MAGLAVAGAGAGAALGRRLVAERRLAHPPDPDLSPAPGRHHMVAVDDGGVLHVVERGSGPPILLVHGVTLSVDVWTYQLRDLADRHRVVAVDQRGHGRSRPGSQGYSFERLGLDVLAVLEALDLRGTIAAGHSMGGMVLLQLAVDQSDALAERVAGLVLVATSGGPVTRLPGWEAVVSALSPGIDHGLARAQERGRVLSPTGNLAYLSARLAFGARPVPAQVELTRQMGTATSPLTVAGLWASVLRFDSSGSCATVELPALVVVGTRDHLTPPWNARRLVAALPRACLVELGGCGHMVMLERRAELDGALRRFARACRPAEDQAAWPGSDRRW